MPLDSKQTCRIFVSVWILIHSRALQTQCLEQPQSSFSPQRYCELIASAKWFLCSPCCQLGLHSRLDWAGIQDGSLTHSWKLSWGLCLSTWILLHKISSCFLGFLQSSKRYHYMASLPPHSVTKMYQDELNLRRRGKGSLFMIHHSTKFTISIEEK